MPELGIKPSPLENMNILIKEFKNEIDVIESNTDIFNLILDYLRDSVEIFFILRRRREKKALDEKKCNEILQNLTKARYNLGELIENIRIFEKNLGKKVFSYFWGKEINLIKKFFEITKKTNLDNVRGMSIKSDDQSTQKFWPKKLLNYI